MTDDLDIDIEAVAAEAKTEFNLMDRLQKRPIRTREVVVYTDEEGGAAHAALASTLAEVKAASSAADLSLEDIQTLEDEKESGYEVSDDLAFERERVTEERAEEYAGLQSEVSRLAKLVHSTGLTVKLRALPPIVVKIADRTTRKAMGIKGTIPSEQIEEFSDNYTAQVLADSIEFILDHESGAKQTDISQSDARGLKDFLPKGEFEKLDSALANLSLTKQISDSVTADADF